MRILSLFLFIKIFVIVKGSVPTVQNVSLNIKLLSYHNEQNKVVDVNNVPRCCDKNEGNRQKCKIWCKPTIEITVYKDSSVLYNETVNNLPPLQQFNFTRNYKSEYTVTFPKSNNTSVSLHVLVYNKNNRDDIIIKESTRIMVQEHNASYMKSNNETMQNRQNTAELRLSWKLYHVCHNVKHGTCNISSGYLTCDENYYGTDCLTYCHVSGHGMCNADGTITCDSHYHGRNCLNYCEDTTHGKCSSDGKLVCDNNYIGPGCSQQCHNNSQGHCDSNGHLSCNENHYGFDCSVFCTKGTTVCKLNPNTGNYVTIDTFVTIFVLIKDSEKLEQTSNKCIIYIRRTSSYLSEIPCSGSHIGVYLEKWMDPDEITATLQVGNVNISTNVIPNNTTPDVDVSSAVAHRASIPTIVNFTSWIYYTKVGEDAKYIRLNNGSIVCKDTYYGKSCINKCPDIAEQLHGTCNTNEGWKCHSGWEGSKCEVAINDCHSNPCKSGNCVNTNRSFLCDTVETLTSIETSTFVVPNIQSTNMSTVNPILTNMIAPILSLETFVSKSTIVNKHLFHTAILTTPFNGITTPHFEQYNISMKTTTLYSDVQSYETSGFSSTISVDEFQISSTQSIFMANNSNSNIGITSILPSKPQIAKFTEFPIIDNLYSDKYMYTNQHMMSQDKGTTNTAILMSSSNNMVSAMPLSSPVPTSQTQVASKVMESSSSNLLHFPHLTSKYSTVYSSSLKTIETTKATTKNQFVRNVGTPSRSTIRPEGFTTDTPTVRKQDSSFKVWIKENMLLVLGVSIGVTVVLVMIVVFMVCRRKKTKPVQTKQAFGPFQNRKLTLLLGPDDELLPEDQQTMIQMNSVYDSHFMTNTTKQAKSTDESHFTKNRDSHYC